MSSGVYKRTKIHFELLAKARKKAIKTWKGCHHTKVAKEKISENNKKLGLIPPSAKGRKWSEKSKVKWSEKQKGSGGNFYGKSHSIKTRKKLSKQRRGKLGVNWKGGLTPITEGARNSVEFKIWRERVFKRDNYTCIACSKRGGKLHPHHIKSFALYPELRFVVSNGETLCENCHKEIKNFGGRALLETEMVKIEQIFLPYMIVGKDETLYERMKGSHFQLTRGGENK